MKLFWKKKKLNVIAVIGARGGSKELPGKNIRLMNGKPLIAYSIESGKKSKYIDKVVVATDDQEIANVSKRYGAEVVLLPPEYATDTAPMEPSLKYAVEWIEKNQNFPVDIMVYLQLTDFFKKPEWIDECIKYLIDHPEVDSCFIGCKEHKNYWNKEGEKYVKLTTAMYVPRQKKEPVFREDTGLGAATRASVIKGGRRLGDNTMIIEKEYPFFDIHTELDFNILEFVTRNYPNIVRDHYKDYKKHK